MGENRFVLPPAERPLDQTYDLAALDLDGVVYVGDHAVAGAAEGLKAARSRGMHLAFITNNASRPPSTVAAHLSEIGIAAGASDVVTSAQAAARLVADQVPVGSEVYVIGGPGLHEALTEHGLEPVVRLTDNPAAVVQGYGPDMPWRQVIDGAILVKEGLPWVASNMDLTVPTTRGPGPGNGALVNLVAEYSGRTPQVAGKPERPLFEETLTRAGGQRPLVVGDRVDTDIWGAHNVGWDSLLVMTGVTRLPDLAALGQASRPTYVGADLSCLDLPVPALHVDESGCRVGGWCATVEGGRLVVRGEGERHDWWRAAAAALWTHLDATGHAADPTGVEEPR
ncbi:MAG TPA: HAD-IIA family hydrolase [Marmoricola sp.]|nr:HAD-IIA family hydrolase [Marmoricola sp.]